VAKNRPCAFIKKTVYMALYKDLFGLSFDKVAAEFLKV